MILIDCPPSLGLLTVNALVAADHALITAEAQYFALQGVEQAMEVDRAGARQPQPGAGAARRPAQPRRHAHRALARGARSLKEHFGDKLLDTVVRQSIAYAESAERAVSIIDHRPDLGADYLALADELLGRLALDDARKAA